MLIISSRSGNYNCSFLDEHLERAINSFIQKLPAVSAKQIEKAVPPTEGFDTIEFTFLGLNSLRPFGPFLTFCRNGSRFVQFDLVNRRRLVLLGNSVDKLQLFLTNTLRGPSTPSYRSFQYRPPSKPEKAVPPIQGFETVEFTIWALSTLRPFGPFLTFCRNDSRFVQFDLVNKGPLLLEGRSVGNDGKTYQILSRAVLVRFTAQFKVEGSGEGLKMYHVENLPVSMVGLNMILKTYRRKKE
ncbi:hypothetical protein MTO96_029606 [Rhipicephalus appendiculatus]